MSDRPAASRSVENLKKEAKRWLRAVHTGPGNDAGANTSLRGPLARSNLVAHAALPGMSGAPP